MYNVSIGFNAAVKLNQVQLKYLIENEYCLNSGLVDTIHLTGCHPLVQITPCIQAKLYQQTFSPLLSILTQSESFSGQQMQVRSPVSSHAVQKENISVSLAPPHTPVSALSRTSPELSMAPAPNQSPAPPSWAPAAPTQSHATPTWAPATPIWSPSATTQPPATPTQSSATPTQAPAAPPSPSPAPKTPSQPVFEDTTPKASGEFPFKRGERGKGHKDSLPTISFLFSISDFVLSHFFL